MTTSPYLNNQLLIAMPGLKDPDFERSVTYICHHNEAGAMGITINRQSDLPVASILDQLHIEQYDQIWTSEQVMIGGPIQQDRGFVLHSMGNAWNSSYPVSEQITLTTSRDILEVLATQQQRDHSLLALGYSGWGPGQLEEEFLQNSWLSAPVDPSILFSCPIEHRWDMAASMLGVDINTLTSPAGHA